MTTIQMPIPPKASQGENIMVGEKLPEHHRPSPHVGDIAQRLSEQLALLTVQY